MILKGVKEYLPLVNMRQYKKYLEGLANLGPNPSFFQRTVIKASLGCLSKFLENARKEEFCQIVTLFTKLQVRSAFHFNQVLIFYGNHFNKFTPHEKIEVIRLFSELSIN